LILYDWLNSDPGIEFVRMSGVLKKYNDIWCLLVRKTRASGYIF